MGQISTGVWVKFIPALTLVAYVDFMPNRTTCIRYKDDKKGHGLIAKEGDPFNIVGKVINFRGGIRISY